jgi:hypothetical protein
VGLEKISSHGELLGDGDGLVSNLTNISALNTEHSLNLSIDH